MTAVAAGSPPPTALLLIPVVGLAMQLLGPGNWFGLQAIDGLDVALIDLTVATAALVLIFRSRAWAATLAAAGLLVLGAYGWLIAVFWPAVPGFAYGFSDLGNNAVPSPLWTDAFEGSLLLALGLWLAPRVMRHQPRRPPDLELAARARQLTKRVQMLTQTRYDAVDTAAAELRRIERDLHDGAQARLVALGMSLRAAERLFPTSPEAALALVAEAKEASSRALTELRDLVRGIYPPVLADRGLADAIRALALDTPLPVELDIDLPGQLEPPVDSAVYFSVAEALANVVKHAHARSVRIQLQPRRRACCGPRSPTTARAAPIPRAGPGWPGWSAGSRRLMASWRSAARRAARPSSSSRCRARCHRRRPLPAEGRPGPAAVRVRLRDRRRGGHRPGAAGRAGRGAPGRGHRRRPAAADAHRRRPAGRPGRPARRCPACRSWCCPSTSSSSTPASCSPTRPAASATCSRTGCSTTSRSPAPSAPWPRAARSWTPRWSRKLMGRRSRAEPLAG